MYEYSGVFSGIGSTTLPAVSIYSPAGHGFTIREISVFNETVTACIYNIVKLTTAGTPGSGKTEVEISNTAAEQKDPGATVFDAHSVAPTLGAVIRRMPIGAAVGAGYYWTWGGKGLYVPAGTSQGVGIILASGTGQLCTVHFSWEED